MLFNHLQSVVGVFDKALTQINVMFVERGSFLRNKP